MQPAFGGCICSAASVSLKNSVVAGCIAISDGGEAGGAGIYAIADTTLILSTLSGNKAMAYSHVWGGAIATGTFNAKYSTVTENSAHSVAYGGVGGGALSWGSTVLLGSTIDNNQAEACGGLAQNNYPSFLNIINSTISENIANSYPALCATSASISNTTVAFNHANDSSSGGAVVGVFGLELQSSIIAENTAGAGNASSDLYLLNGNPNLSGNNNLVITTNQAPPNVITVTADPKLGPLQFNGGRTRTHALLPGSPAIGVGNNDAMKPYDQRGIGYPRTTGAAATTDIGSFQFDSIFANAFEW